MIDECSRQRERQEQRPCGGNGHGIRSATVAPVAGKGERMQEKVRWVVGNPSGSSEDLGFGMTLNHLVS